MLLSPCVLALASPLVVAAAPARLLLPLLAWALAMPSLVPTAAATSLLPPPAKASPRAVVVPKAPAARAVLLSPAPADAWHSPPVMAEAKASLPLPAFAVAAALPVLAAITTAAV